MSSAELEEKQRQLDDLQRSFNEYVESSKELESELETALEEAAEKIDRAAEREAASQRKTEELQAKVDELTRSLNNKPRDNGKQTDNEDLLIKHRRLENENEDLQNQVRILEASVEDLNHRVQGLEEDAIFLKTDIEAITLSRDELEAEMNDTVDALQQKLDISENDRRKLSADIAAMTKKMLDDPAAHDPNDDKVQMLLFKQDKDIDFIKSTLDALAVENNEAHRHGHHDHHSPQWHERVEELRTKLREAEQEKHELSEEVFELKKQLERQMHAAENFYKREHFEELERAFHESEHERAQLLEELSESEQKLNAATEALSEMHANQQPQEDIAELKKKLQAAENAADELAAQVATLQQHLEALIPEAQVADELRDVSAHLRHELEQQGAKLRELEAAKHDLEGANQDLEAAKRDLEQELDQALKDGAGPKFHSVGSYISNVNISSATHTSVIEISSISTTHVTVTEVINSGDIELMKAELIRLVRFLLTMTIQLFTWFC
jgi:chromosome segregation ATPase